MGVVVFLLIGLVAGFIARALVPGPALCDDYSNVPPRAAWEPG